MRPWLLLIALAACQTAPVVEPARPDPDPAPAVASGCAIRYFVETSALSVVAMAENLSDAEVTVTLPDRCPGQPVVLLGLGDGYDADNTCTMGMCAYDEIPAPDTRRIPPHESIALASWTIDPTGSSCNAALVPGSYTVSFDASAFTTSAATCGPDGATIVVDEPERAPEAKCPPMPACGIGCPRGMAHDENGCTLCACEKDPLEDLRKAP